MSRKYHQKQIFRFKKIRKTNLRTEAERLKNSSLAKKLEVTQEELMKTQIKYQKEIEKLERENKELRKQILLKAGQKVAAKTVKKSLIDMYSEVGTLCHLATWITWATWIP